MSLKKKIYSYVESTTSWKVEDSEFELTLPFHIKLGYELWYAKIAGQKIIFAKGLENDIRKYYKTVALLEEQSNTNVVLVFEKLSSSDINRLVKKHISFVILDKYIYMPFALMQIESQKIVLPLKKLKQLTPLADVVLLGYLIGKIKTGLMISEIANIVDQGIREVSSALTLLEQYRFVRVEKEGRKKLVFFENREEVFDYFVEKQALAIHSTFFTDSKIEEENILYSSLTALSCHSRLLDNGMKTIAIDIKNKSLISSLNECFEEDALYKVELWDRNPAIFSENQTINPLYLLRAFRDSDDERIGYELEDIRSRVEDEA